MLALKRNTPMRGVDYKVLGEESKINEYHICQGDTLVRLAANEVFPEADDLVERLEHLISLGLCVKV